MRILDHLLKCVRNAAVFDHNVVVAPACILWPDRDRQWEEAISALRAEMPELLMLGDYAPGERMGPAIWLRCVIAKQVPEVSLPSEATPVLYLPGVSRQDLRAVESCPDHLKPIAELQYQGVIWSQANAKDWTIFAFLKSDQGGLGLDVTQDSDTRNAMRLALAPLLDEDVSPLAGKRLDQDYFNTLLTGDPIRDLLQWLDQGDAFRSGKNENAWEAFVEICKSKLNFDPQNEGSLAGAGFLAIHEGPWHAVWERFREAPRRYPKIPSQIRKCQIPEFDLLADEELVGGWPQWNDDQERRLGDELIKLAEVPAHEARTKIADLEEQHGRRRSLVWAELDDAPLACALEHLATVAEVTQSSLAAGSLDDLASGYQNSGWRADNGVIQALALVKGNSDRKAVTTAIRSVYLPWLEASARHLQKLVEEAAYPGGSCLTATVPAFEVGDCMLFVDGLRFDTGELLAASLEKSGFDITGHPAWTALPSVTATGKPAVSPVVDKIRGEDGSTDFDPAVADTGQSLQGGYHLKKLLKAAGWTILERTDNGNGQGMAWCEFGDIDHEGHERGWKLAQHIDAMIEEISGRVAELLASGWRRVRVVTDHGWLLLPGGLPKIDLPGVLAETKWGRCAALKPGAKTDERLFPWFWNPNHSFALADGVSCFKKGEEYTHGGLSLQECLTLQLTVTRGDSVPGESAVEFTDVVWKGLRCTIAVDGDYAGLSLDIRSQPGNASSSMVVGAKLLKENGTASVVVEDEDREGSEATIVLTDLMGSLVAQCATRIGGEKT